MQQVTETSNETLLYIENWGAAALVFLSPYWTGMFSYFHQYGPDMAQGVAILLGVTQIARNLVALKRGRP